MLELVAGHQTEESWNLPTLCTKVNFSSNAPS